MSVSWPHPERLNDVLQHLFLVFVVLIRPSAGKQAVHAPVLGSRNSNIFPINLRRTQET